MKLRDEFECTGCEACVSSCPKKCISMKMMDDGFMYPVVDENLCIDCKKCEKVCSNLAEYRNYRCKRPYIGYADYYQKSGSSGGIIGLFAESVLDNGVVYGAAFDSDFSVEHIRIDSKEDLNKIFKSKYVQGRIGDVYLKVKEDLTNAKKVLFTGTPCQIAGLKSFLGKEYETLITIEMICHGIPSPGIWQRYLSGKTEGKEVKSVDFRDKRVSWNKFCIAIKCDDFEICSIAGKDDYMKRFLGDQILRNSCYNCMFRGLKRVADITVGDAWCHEEVLSRLPRYKDGTSSILINTDKGMALFQSVKDRLEVCEVSAAEAIGYNNSYFLSPCRPSTRKKLSITQRTLESIPALYSGVDRILYFGYRIKAKLVCSVLKKWMDKDEKNTDNH